MHNTYNMVVDDEYGTPDDLFKEVCTFHGVTPELDVCADKLNRKCNMYLSDALEEDWTAAVWCNPPHSKTIQFVQKAWEQWMKHNIDILLIIPANSVCTKYAKKFIKGSATIEPIYYRPKFLKDGKPSKYNSRNSYFSVCYHKLSYTSYIERLNNQIIREGGSLQVSTRY